MTIQWFPGHMHATRKAMAERVRDVDAVVELLDARLPGSSENPLLAELTRGKPALKLLNKQDLADPALTRVWLDHLQARPATRALAMDASERAPARRLEAACRALLPNRGGLVKPLRVLICGIPNVGKSTLINSMLGQRAARTGDEPGITKTEQRIMLAEDFALIDTPGLLWPRIEVDESGLLLAASGAVGRNAYDEEEVARALLGRVRPRYADRLATRYRFAPAPAAPDDEVLTEIGRRRGALGPGGRISLQKAAEVVLNDFRSGAWGPLTLDEAAARALARSGRRLASSGDEPEVDE
ncbi:ribosome biogenesis GTPase YlqF [Piscinibacter sakaiensis]|uniref:ribosome biogenesis GTPase YlqF n=1 Tax=Piscinibacter sakaiensis TaxID=1547922 RepID=UPI00372BA6BE